MVYNEGEVCVPCHSECFEGTNSLNLLIGLPLILWSDAHDQYRWVMVVPGCPQPVLGDIDESPPCLNKSRIGKSGYVYAKRLSRYMQLSSEITLSNTGGENHRRVAALAQEAKYFHSLLGETI